MDYIFLYKSIYIHRGKGGDILSEFLKKKKVTKVTFKHTKMAQTA